MNANNNDNNNNNEMTSSTIPNILYFRIIAVGLLRYLLRYQFYLFQKTKKALCSHWTHVDGVVEPSISVGPVVLTIA